MTVDRNAILERISKLDEESQMWLFGEITDSMEEIHRMDNLASLLEYYDLPVLIDRLAAFDTEDMYFIDSTWDGICSADSIAELACWDTMSDNDLAFAGNLMDKYIEGEKR